MTQPNWDDLRLFLEVSRYPRLAEAAKRLGVDATTIGRRLRRLEQDLGSILFERTPKGHVLTAAGVNLTQRVESLEQLTREITSEIAGETERASGRVRLSVTEGFGTAVMAPAVHEFIKVHVVRQSELRRFRLRGWIFWVILLLLLFVYVTAQVYSSSYYYENNFSLKISQRRCSLSYDTVCSFRMILY